MTKIFSLVTFCSLPLLVLAVGCAAPTTDDGETTSQDLSATSSPTVSTVGARIIDPLCREHILRSDACVLDNAWHERAAQLCKSEHMRVESFRVLQSCGGPTPTPASGNPSGGPSTGGTGSASGGPSTGGGASGGVIPIDPSATEVEVACCNYSVEPSVRPESGALVAH